MLCIILTGSFLGLISGSFAPRKSISTPRSVSAIKPAVSPRSLVSPLTSGRQPLRGTSLRRGPSSQTPSSIRRNASEYMRVEAAELAEEVQSSSQIRSLEERLSGPGEITADDFAELRDREVSGYADLFASRPNHGSSIPYAAAENLLSQLSAAADVSRNSLILRGCKDLVPDVGDTCLDAFRATFDLEASRIELRKNYSRENHRNFMRKLSILNGLCDYLASGFPERGGPSISQIADETVKEAQKATSMGDPLAVINAALRAEAAARDVRDYVESLNMFIGFIGGWYGIKTGLTSPLDSSRSLSRFETAVSLSDIVISLLLGNSEIAAETAARVRSTFIDTRSMQRWTRDLDSLKGYASASWIGDELSAASEADVKAAERSEALSHVLEESLPTLKVAAKRIGMALPQYLSTGGLSGQEVDLEALHVYQTLIQSATELLHSRAEAKKMRLRCFLRIQEVSTGFKVRF